MTGQPTIATRPLSRRQIANIWAIDRSEVIDGVYYLEEGKLVLKPEHYNMTGWPPGEAEQYTPLLEACFDRGGWFCGLFENDQLIGVAILDSRLIGRDRDQLQLKFLHISRDCRGKGLGRQLFKLAEEEAQRRGAKGLYISATPSEHTVNFYLQSGCRLAAEPDPELYELEPEDIHLDYVLPVSEE